MNEDPFVVDVIEGSNLELLVSKGKFLVFLLQMIWNYKIKKL